ERVALADDRPLDLVEDAARPVAELGELHHRRSSVSTSARSRRSGSPGAVRSPGGGLSGRRSSHASSPTSALARSARNSRSIPSFAAVISRRSGSSRMYRWPALEAPSVISRSIRTSSGDRKSVGGGKGWRGGWVEGY